MSTDMLSCESGWLCHAQPIQSPAHARHTSSYRRLLFCLRTTVITLFNLTAPANLPPPELSPPELIWAPGEGGVYARQQQQHGLVKAMRRHS